MSATGNNIFHLNVSVPPSQRENILVKKNGKGNIKKMQRSTEGMLVLFKSVRAPTCVCVCVIAESRRLLGTYVNAVRNYILPASEFAGADLQL